MLVDIQTLLQGKATFIALDTEYGQDEWSVSFQGSRLTRPIAFAGRLTAAGDGVFELEGRLETAIAGECARCLDPVQRPVVVQVEESFRPSAEQSGTEIDDSYRYKGFVVDILPALRDNLVLALPQRLLCREECRGICPDCGENLNEATCSCAGKRSEMNAPFNQLKHLL